LEDFPESWKKIPLLTAEIAGQIFKMSLSANCANELMLFR
jgi:hypothetical protein